MQESNGNGNGRDVVACGVETSGGFLAGNESGFEIKWYHEKKSSIIVKYCNINR